ncbi:nuclear transport factor 2 family protein [Bacillus sp. ISL-39]|uniref:nuclear transport factor 2 family protein n=1 Tax=Bacillus sp. ISL-39 TaxID=2819124 RepID=UPI001BE8C8F2|nr:nuclear transport factor 2 family protein [Bacillus sp. ISL-39]MBT2639783.1 hypothetical protein [Bacillus sp. ISL-39]
MKKLLLLIVCFIPIITACTDTETVDQLMSEKETLAMELTENKEEIERLNAKIEKSNEKMSDLEKQLETYQKENDLFSQISYLSREFVKAHTTGDKEAAQALLSDELILVERDNKLLVKGKDNYEWNLYSADNGQLDDWVIQGFQYLPDQDSYRVHIREFIIDANGEPVIPPTFLNLTFKLVNGEWKVDGVEFDV